MTANGRALTFPTWEGCQGSELIGMRRTVGTAMHYTTGDRARPQGPIAGAFADPVAIHLCKLKNLHERPRTRHIPVTSPTPLTPQRRLVPNSSYYERRNIKSSEGIECAAIKREDVSVVNLIVRCLGKTNNWIEENETSRSYKSAFTWRVT